MTCFAGTTDKHYSLNLIGERMAYIYGPNGEYRGETSNVAPEHREQAKIIFLLIVFGGGGWLLWNFLSNWQALPHPYKYVAAYYYHLLVVPLKWFSTIWQHSTTLTGYPNLNLVIGGLAVVLYGVLGIPLMIGLSLAALQKLKIQRYWSTILFGPATLSLLWLVGSSILGWLFAR